MAETAYRGALALETTDARVWNNLGGLLYEKLLRPSEGIHCLEQGLKMDPHNKLAWSNLATMVGRWGAITRRWNMPTGPSRWTPRWWRHICTKPPRRRP